MENNQTEQTINIQDLFSIIWKNIILVGSITFIITLAVGLFTKFGIEEKYTSVTTVRVSSSSSYNEITGIQKITKTYSYLGTSESVLGKVIENLDLEINYKELKKLVKLTPIPDTEILEFEVVMKDAYLASAVANEAANLFIAKMEDDDDVENIYVVDEAKVSSAPSSPNLKLNVVIGFVLGGMISVGFVLLKEFLDRTIKSEEDVQKHLNVPVLGAIPTLDKKYLSTNNN